MSASTKKEKNTNKEKKSKNVGSVTQIIGPVLDVVFPAGKMPNIYNALLVQGKNKSGEEISVTCEGTTTSWRQLCSSYFHDWYRWSYAWNGCCGHKESFDYSCRRAYSRSYL